MKKYRGFANKITFKPAGAPLNILKLVTIELNEFEAIRFYNYKGKNQIEDIINFYKPKKEEKKWKNLM